MVSNSIIIAGNRCIIQLIVSFRFSVNFNNFFDVKNVAQKQILTFNMSTAQVIVKYYLLPNIVIIICTLNGSTSSTKTVPLVALVFFFSLYLNRINISQTSEKWNNNSCHGLLRVSGTYNVGADCL